VREKQQRKEGARTASAHHLPHHLAIGSHPASSLLLITHLLDHSNRLHYKGLALVRVSSLVCDIASVVFPTTRALIDECRPLTPFAEVHDGCGECEKSSKRKEQEQEQEEL
jgi:hypothetical protein